MPISVAEIQKKKYRKINENHQKAENYNNDFYEINKIHINEKTILRKHLALSLISHFSLVKLKQHHNTNRISIKCKAATNGN